MNRNFQFQGGPDMRLVIHGGTDHRRYRSIRFPRLHAAFSPYLHTL